MARVELKFPAHHSLSSNEFRAVTVFGRGASRSAALKMGGLFLAAALAVAPPLFAQRGGGGGGGGGSAGGGSHGGGSFGSVSSGGSHSGGESVAYSGASHGARGSGGASSPRAGHANSAGSPEGFGSKAHATGVRAALFRFFGLGRTTVEREPELSNSTDLLVTRAAESAKLPPVFSRIRLSESPAAFGLVGSTRHRLPPPRPPHSPPIVYGGGYSWYGPDLGFGFGFPLLFDLDFFDYFNWFPSWQSNVHVPPTMLLYLSDGSALEVTDYWVEGVNLLYVTEDDRGSGVPISDLDIQRTIDANARLGFRFRLDRAHRGTPLDPLEPAIPPQQSSQPDQSDRPNQPLDPQQAKPPSAQLI
jgi:hypothetical protein